MVPRGTPKNPPHGPLAVDLRLFGFHLIIFFSETLENPASNHHEAVGGFFDASQERADNTSFEGYETNYHIPEHRQTAEAFRAGGRDIHGQRYPERIRR